MCGREISLGRHSTQRSRIFFKKRSSLILLQSTCSYNAYNIQIRCYLGIVHLIEAESLDVQCTIFSRIRQRPMRAHGDAALTGHVLDIKHFLHLCSWILERPIDGRAEDEAENHVALLCEVSSAPFFSFE